MRKIKKKEIKNYNLDKINIILISVLFAIYLFVGIYIHINKPQYGETFINLDYDINDIKDNMIRTFRKYNKPQQDINTVEEETPIFQEEVGVEDESYIIEQERIKLNRMDKYKIKGQTGNLKFVTDGLWDINKIDFNIISVHGGILNINNINGNIFKFNLEDYNIKFTYKKSYILGKITINDDIHFYIKKFNRSINFYDEYNNRVSNGTYFKSEPYNENMIHFYKLVFDTKYSKYKQVFLVVYIIYLQILKNENYSEIAV